MKLKVLPPTLRKNNRYLALEIKSEMLIDKEDLVLIVWDGCIRFFGECKTSNFNLWVMKFFEMGKTDEYYCYKAIVRCQRDYSDEVRSAIALVNKYNRKRIAMTTVGLSGTIKGSMEYI